MRLSKFLRYFQINRAMDNDKTILKPKKPGGDQQQSRGGVEVSFRGLDGRFETRRFFSAFSIGRGSDCDIHEDNPVVSRRHATVFPDGDAWYIRDLGSSNGTYVNGNRIDQIQLVGHCEIVVGKEGPRFWADPILPEQLPKTVEPESVTKFVNRYFDAENGAAGDEHTRVVREAFERISKKQTLRYKGVVAGMSLLFVAAVGVGIYQYFHIKKLYALTTDIFYTMKSFEVQLAKDERSVQQSGADQDLQEVKKKREQLAKLESEYENYLEQTGFFDQSLSAEDRVIFNIARIFGECELNMPEDFSSEVKLYIKKWQSTRKLKSALARAEVYDFMRATRKAMAINNLPVQFFYLGLKESGFKVDSIGPDTRYGIAKGAWQFIPATAVRYGLKMGPLVEERQFDASDDRFDVFKSTHAAARYLKDIYATEAQASGLLVMASYNWGENNIRRLLKKMPEDPRHRNFWELIKHKKIPKETYDYVLYIFAAAVIGENPGLFGFDFDKPFVP